MYIGIDLDGVLFSLHEDVIEEYNNIYKEKISIKDIVTWDLDDLPTYKKFFMNKIYNPDFVRIQNTYLEANSFLRILSSNFTPILMTLRPYCVAQATMQSLFNCDIIYDTAYNISFGKDHLTLPYYIEDDPKQALKFANLLTTKRVFLRNQPYNQDKTLRKHERITPFNNFDEVLKCL